jgi:hypothetical protein
VRKRAIYLRRISILLIILAGALAAAFFSLRAHFAEECAPEKQTNILAANEAHEAVMTEKECAGAFASGYHDYFVRVRNHSKAGDKGTEIFVTDSEPGVAWRDDDHLVITINYPSFIGTNLHQAEGISIVYRIADGLLETNYKNSLAERKRRVLQGLRDDAFQRGIDLSSSLKSAEEAFQTQFETYNRFMRWAKENVENDNLFH